MATILSVFEHLDLDAVLRYYGLLCMFCLPVSLAVLIFIYRRRPELVQRFNSAVDKMAGDGRAKPSDPSGDAPAAEKPVLSTEEENDLDGIPNLVLHIGDRYRCMMSAKNRQDVGGTNFALRSANDFVGRVSGSKNIFTALKAGETYIESEAGSKPIYYAVVRPTDEEWPVKDALKDVFTACDIANVKVRRIKEKILSLDTEHRILEYEVPGGTLKYEYAKDDSVRRILYVLKESSVDREDMEKKIREYMEQVPYSGPADGKTRYWYHQNGYDEGGFVDFVAMMKSGGDGRVYLAVGECWRYGASVEEIAENPLMTDRSFGGLLPAELLPAKVGNDLCEEMTEEEKNGREEMERANRAGRADEPAVSEEVHSVGEQPADTGEEEDSEAEDDVDTQEVPDVVNGSADPFENFREPGEGDPDDDGFRNINTTEN